MNLEAVNQELDECIEAVRKYKNEFVTEELLLEVNNDYMERLQEYYEDNKLEDISSEDISLYMERLITKLKPNIEKYSKQYAENIDGRFFEFFAQFVVVDMKQKLFEDIVDDLPIENVDSPLVSEIRMKYHDEYQLILEASAVSEEVAQKLHDEFKNYSINEMYEAQIDISSKDIDIEENREFLRGIIKVFKEDARIKYGDTITEELLDITTQSAFVQLEVLHMQKNPEGIEFAIPTDASRDEVEIMMRKAMKEHPHLFEGKNIEDLIDNAMYDIDSEKYQNKRREEELASEKRVTALEIELESLQTIEEFKNVDAKLENLNKQNIILNKMWLEATKEEFDFPHLNKDETLIEQLETEREYLKSIEDIGSTSEKIKNLKKRMIIHFKLLIEEEIENLNTEESTVDKSSNNRSTKLIMAVIVVFGMLVFYLEYVR